MRAEREVSLNGVRIPARIGIYEFEHEHNRPFVVDFSLTMPCEIKEEAVTLADSIDYERMLAIVTGVMKEPEQLLETVANRIILLSREAFPQAVAARLSIQKKDPPLSSEADSSSVSLYVRFDQ